eukprot:TRINITY_DN33808_c0_g1_i1.p1 TRINITY_DN33808_c0_g1~~TRINITY_DN33808_c0_g1_i1.p1  ORF type:complete len:343 (-),score=77.74 TRINITY_DN33808_c0_g1_i1:8-1036(-)
MMNKNKMVEKEPTNLATEVTMITKGSCTINGNNPSTAHFRTAYGVMMVVNGKSRMLTPVVEDFKDEEDSTNNRADLKAVIMALRNAKLIETLTSGDRVTVISNTEYVITACKAGTYGPEAKNKDLLDVIFELTSAFSPLGIQIEFVRQSEKECFGLKTVKKAVTHARDILADTSDLPVAKPKPEEVAENLIKMKITKEVEKKEQVQNIMAYVTVFQKLQRLSFFKCDNDQVPVGDSLATSVTNIESSASHNRNILLAAISGMNKINELFLHDKLNICFVTSATAIASGWRNHQDPKGKPPANLDLFESIASKLQNDSDLTFIHDSENSEISRLKNLPAETTE